MQMCSLNKVQMGGGRKKGCREVGLSGGYIYIQARL